MLPSTRPGLPDVHVTHQVASASSPGSDCVFRCLHCRVGFPGSLSGGESLGPELPQGGALWEGGYLPTLFGISL